MNYLTMVEHEKKVRTKIGDKMIHKSQDKQNQIKVSTSILIMR